MTSQSQEYYLLRRCRVVVSAAMIEALLPKAFGYTFFTYSKYDNQIAAYMTITLAAPVMAMLFLEQMTLVIGVARNALNNLAYTALLLYVLGLSE